MQTQPSPSVLRLPTPPESPAKAPTPAINRRRYRRTLRFFARVIASVVWWELVLRGTLGSSVVSKGRAARLQRYARDFRALAVELGGVMIKMGQFFSARVDMLPVAITDELAGLQDEVPPEDFDDIRAVIEADLGPLAETFAHFDTTAHAAASLGQVYRARLHNGERVIVKVQRPGIERLVATDLAALEVVGRWAMRYRAIRRRANVPALMDEFSKTLWEELDYHAEASNAERFGQIFADDPQVYVPAVYREFSTLRVLTLEDVTAIKITDNAALDKAGIDRIEVALGLFRLYMVQIFEHRFFHADPHPGNLFVYPLPDETSETPPGSSRNGTRKKRPFYLVFVDFGMVGHISDRILAGMREALLAVGTRDMQRVVDALKIMDVLLPNADTERIAQVEQQVFDRMWGMNMRELRNMGFNEMHEFMHEFRDIIYAMPFQVPQNMIYLGRALGILSGMCTNLDPEFNPSTAIAPYAQKLVNEELKLNSGTLLDELRKLGRVALSLPGMAERVLERAERGELKIQTALDPATQHQQRRLERAVNQLAIGLVFASLTISGTVLVINDERGMGLAAFAISGMSLMVMLWAQIRH